MKLSILEFFGTAIRPEGPSGKNMHQFPHHGLYSKTGGGKPKTNNKSPYEDEDSDLINGDWAAEEAAFYEAELAEFFKFTVSPSDNTSFHRPPTYGTGFPKAYGKSSKAFGTYDPKSDKVEDEDEDETEDKFSTIQGKDFQKVKKIEEGPSMGQRHPRDEGDYITKQPFASGMPGYDKKDITNAEEKIDAYLRELEKEDPSLKEWFTSDHSQLMHTKRAKQPKSDLDFWKIVDDDNVYLMNKFDKKAKNEKDKKF